MGKRSTIKLSGFINKVFSMLIVMFWNALLSAEATKDVGGTFRQFGEAEQFGACQVDEYAGSDHDYERN